jgi:hypothetical protein
MMIFFSAGTKRSLRPSPGHLHLHCLLPLYEKGIENIYKYTVTGPYAGSHTLPGWSQTKWLKERGTFCPSPMLVFYIPPC